MSVVTLESGLGKISFDGQVLEVFGFGEQGSRRIHLGQIQRIELGEALVDEVRAGAGKEGA